MPLTDAAGLSLSWSCQLVQALHRSGVNHAFISPGSRSTPITLALVHHPGITCHSVLDERSAAFMALGAGKVSGVPALFVCTSGTAVANAYPAVVEARMSAVPLIVISADRPPKMRATGASQTIDQIKIFGDYPVFFFDTGEAVDTKTDFRRIRHLGVQAFQKSVTNSGPVHINMPFRKPLEPTRSQIEHCADFYAGVTVPHITEEALRPLPDQLKDVISGSERPLVIAGTDAQKAAAFSSWCRKNHIPVLAETGGVPGAFTMHPLVLRDTVAAESLAPDLILRIGGHPLHRPTMAAMKKWDVPQVLFSDHPDRSDITLSATQLVSGMVQQYDWKPFTPEVKSWERFFSAWSAETESVSKTWFGKIDAEKRFTDAHVYRHLLPLAEDTKNVQMVVSNSFPVRDYLLSAPTEIVSKLPVLVNRGASGIDGVTSTAVGSALDSGCPTVLFTGDLAFFHDTGALNNLMVRDISLKIIVVNNGGGTIFRMLPFESRDRLYNEFFETPQHVKIREIAAAHNIPFERADSVHKLKNTWEKLGEHRVGILECRTDADASMNLRNTY